MKALTFSDLTLQKKLMLLGWLVALAIIIFFLVYEFEGGSKKNKGIAVISALKGQVQMREAEQLLWKPTEREAVLALNDYIATGDESSTRLVFVSGRIIELGSNTQIRITASDSSSDDGNVTIDLLKGQIKALPTSAKMATIVRKRTKHSNNPVILHIQASGQVFKLQSNKAVLELQKPTETAAVAVVSATKGIESLKDGKKVALKPVVATKEPAPVEAPEVAPAQPTPPPPVVASKPVEPVARPKTIRKQPKVQPSMALAAKNPPKIAAINVKDYLPTVASNTAGATFWFADPLDTVLSRGKLPITLRAPTRKPDNANWVPVIKAVPGNDQSLAMGQAQFADQDIAFDLAKASSAIQRSNGAMAEAKLSLSPGVLLTRDGKALQAAAYGPPASVTVRSLKNLSGNVIFELGGLKYKEGPSPFVKEQDTKGKLTSIYLASATGFGQMLPFLRGADGFRVRQGTMSLSGQGTFFVKNQQIIGALQGETSSYEDLDLLRRQVGADYIFTGSTSALIGDATVMMKKLAANELPERFYVFQKGNFIGINANFVRTNENAQQFVLNKSASFFSQPIKILAPVD